MTYATMTPGERFIELDRLATQLFGTTRWKTAFAERYDITRQTIAVWSKSGPPLWALEIARGALASERLETIRQAVKAADQ